MSKQLVPGDAAPAFKSQAVQRGEIVDLTLEDALKGAEYLMLVFYPADFTFVCPTEIIQFMEKHSEFEKHRCNVVCCSTDSEYTHLAWLKSPKSERGLGGSNSSPIVLLSDRSHDISSAYGVLAENGAAYRGTFLIDQKKTISQVTINDMPVGRSVDDALRMLSELRSKVNAVAPVQTQVNSSNVQPSFSKPHRYPRLLAHRRQSRQQLIQRQMTKDSAAFPQALTHSSGVPATDANQNGARSADQQNSTQRYPSTSEHPEPALQSSTADKQRRGLAERAAELETLAAQLRLRDSEERLSRIQAQVERLRVETEKQRANTERLKAEAQLKHREWDRLLRGDDAVVLGGDVSESSGADDCQGANRKPEPRTPRLE